MKKKMFFVFLLLITCFFVFSDTEVKSDNDSFILPEEIYSDTDEDIIEEPYSDILESIDIVDGEKIKSKIDLKEGFEAPLRTFSFTVSESTFGVELKISDAQADLDLFVYREGDNAQLESEDYCSETEFYNESLFISRLSEIPLETGKYYVDVSYQYSSLPEKKEGEFQEIEFSLSLRTVSSLPSVNLTPGKVYKMKLLPENGMFTSASINVPRGTKTFRVDVFDTNADVDIFAALDSPAMSIENSLYNAECLLGTESLIVKDDSGAAIDKGKYFLTFVDQISNQLEQEFSVTVTLGPNVPNRLLEIPNIPLFEENFDTALVSTVEIISGDNSGSGCLVSSDGYIITNFHVIEGPDRKTLENIYVAISLFNDQPPKELFSASVVDVKEKLDIALLKIDKGRYGQELPHGLKFPFLRIGDSKDITIGQPLGVVGYPDVGGVGSRATITFTKGVISGFEKIGSITYIKTNALISGGNSGGAVINAYYELLGLPCYVIDSGNVEMAYVYPVKNLPNKWLNIIGTKE